MGYRTFRCKGCRIEHDAAFWYVRSVIKAKGKKTSTKEYLCGVKYNELRNKGAWEPYEP